ncbi:hypothetical protein BDZ89DRAFT_1080672 [Hymenopellis radicata]|nr:hypothetical protein BDZ89DRAFT_1080672 [Hymenopellis radicata]
MSQSTPTPIHPFPEAIRLVQIALDPSDPLHSLLNALQTASLLILLQFLVVPGFFVISTENIVELSDGHFTIDQDLRLRSLTAYLILRDAIYYGFNNVLGKELVSPQLPDALMLEILEFGADESLLCQTLYRCISYIPAFHSATWATQAEALAHGRTVQLYLGRLASILGAMVQISLDEGLAHLWDFGACDGWTAFEFLASAAPSFIALEAEMRGISVDELKDRYEWRAEVEASRFFWEKESLIVTADHEDYPNSSDTESEVFAESPSSEVLDEDSWSIEAHAAFSEHDLDTHDPCYFRPDVDYSSDNREDELVNFEDEAFVQRFERALGLDRPDTPLSWNHVSDVEQLDTETAMQLSRDEQMLSPLGLTGQLEMFRRLDENLPPRSALFVTDSDDENYFGNAYDADLEYSSDYSSDHSDSSSVFSEASIYTNASDDAVVLSLAPFGRRDLDDDSHVGRYHQSNAY